MPSAVLFAARAVNVVPYPNGALILSLQALEAVYMPCTGNKLERGCAPRNQH